MVELKILTAYLDNLLNLKDFCGEASNNGLQFEGARREVAKAVFAVDSSLELFKRAAAMNADFIFTHHGISWGSSLKRIRGIDADRVAVLASNGVSLYAAHLPLDAHPALGHNARLFKLAGLQYPVPFGEYETFKIGFSGYLREALPLADIAARFDALLPSSGKIEIFGDPARAVSRVGIVSGGGAWPAIFNEMRDSGIECLVTGEMGHECYHCAKEAGAPVVSLGHYRSETPGVLAVLADIRANFSIETEFIDIPTNM